MKSSNQQQVQEGRDQSVRPKSERPVTVFCCPHCGTAAPGPGQFCEECGGTLHQHKCSHCGAGIKAGSEICPQCGHALQQAVCSFCGAPMSQHDLFCPACGNPRAGLVCSKCNALNFRSFCRKCNAPLNEMAQQALQEAKADPVFQKAGALAEDLAVLEDYLLLPVSGGAIQSPNPSANPLPAARPAISLSFSISSREEALAAYQQKSAEMQQCLEAMHPDAGMTPQMQRNYYAARKVEVITKTKVKVKLGWLCNAYGCYHDNPNDCTEPFKGGKWVYEEREEMSSAWQYEKK